MPTVLQFRRGTTSQNNSFTGADGELSIDSTVDSLRIHDGSTAGGFEVNAKQAKYADIAERYRADGEYDTGTVLMFGGDEEVTICGIANCTKIAGVVSSVDQAYAVMNSPKGERDNPAFPPLALLGRVPCKVIGAVEKGDLMVSSGTPGHAQAFTGQINPMVGSVIGKAVEAKTDTGSGTIEVVVGRL